MQAPALQAPSNAGAGAVIGGPFGALLGASIAGHGDRRAGAFVSGLAGAAGGAAIASTTSNDTSQGCPPGFVVRNGAPAFYYRGYGYGRGYGRGPRPYPGRYHHRHQ